MDDQTELKQDTSAPVDIPLATGFKKFVFLLAAGFFLVLAILGVFVGGLPTTPFLLLTSYFLVRTSPELNRKLLQSRLFGPILTDWQVKRGVRRDIKVKAISMVVLAVSATIYFSDLSPLKSIAVICVASIGVFVIVRLPTLEKIELSESDDPR